MTDTSSPKKFGGCWLPAIGAAVLIGGGAAAYWFLNRSGGGDISAAGNATTLPDETIALVHLNPSSFDKLSEFGTPAAQAQVREAFAGVLAEISPELDWENDLKPWVGSVTLGLAEPTEGTEETELQAYLAIGIRNQLKAMQFARALESETGDGGVVKMEYSGIEVIQVRPDANDVGTTVAMVNDRLLVTNSLANMQQAIDDVNASQTASVNPEFQQVLAEAEEVAEPLLRVYIPDTSAFAALNGDRTVGEAGEAAAERADNAAVRSAIATVNATDNGLHGKVQVLLDGDRELPEFVALSDRIEQQFPEQTLVLLAGNNLGATWTQLVARAEAPDAPPEVQQTLGTLREGFASLGLDADREVFSWLDGEAAIGSFPVSSGLLQQVGVAAAAILETSDRDTATATLDKLAKVANDRIPVPLREGERQLGDIELKEWTIPVPGLGSGGLFGYGWRGDNLLVGLSSPALEAVAQPGATSLSDNPNFQAVMRDLPSKKAGYAYVNLVEVDRRLQSIPVGVPNTLSPEAMVMLGASRGLGLTLVSESPDRLAIEMSLALVPLSEAADAPADAPAEPEGESE